MVSVSNQNVNIPCSSSVVSAFEPIEIGRHVVRQDVVGRDGRVDVADADDAVGLGNGQRPQQHGVDDGEDGGVGAQADGERQDDGGAEARVLDEQPELARDVAHDSGASVPRAARSIAACACVRRGNRPASSDSTGSQSSSWFAERAFQSGT